MKHMYWQLCALAASLAWAEAACAQPQDAGQPRAGQPLSAQQVQEFQFREQENQRARREEEQAAERRAATGMLYQLAGALDEGDFVLAARSIEGEQGWGILRQISAGMRRPYGARSFQLLPLFADAPEGQDEFEARVAIVLRRSDPLDLADDPLLRDKATFIESVTLRRGASREWKIVPRPAPPAAPPPAPGSAQAQLAEFEARVKAAQGESDGFLNTWARALTQPRALLAGAVSRTSMSNVKQMMLGVMQFTQDNDEKLAFTTANFVEKLMPYVKARDIFLAPPLDEEKPIAYALNPEVVGKSLAQFAEVARTVAVYEADAQGRPLFRFGGKAVIGFMDGHVKLTPPDEAEKLIWRP